MVKKNGKNLYRIALVFFSAGLGCLVYTGLTRYSVASLNVSEALASSPNTLKSARVSGTVSGEGLERTGDGTGLRFHLKDTDDSRRTLAVRYTGVIPATFKAGSEVIVEGDLKTDGTFEAKTLMTKCPSKYRKKTTS